MFSFFVHLIINLLVGVSICCGHFLSYHLHCFKQYGTIPTGPAVDLAKITVHFDHATKDKAPQNTDRPSNVHLAKVVHKTFKSCSDLRMFYGLDFNSASRF